MVSFTNSKLSIPKNAKAMHNMLTHAIPITAPRITAKPSLEITPIDISAIPRLGTVFVSGKGMHTAKAIINPKIPIKYEKIPDVINCNLGFTMVSSRSNHGIRLWIILLIFLAIGFSLLHPGSCSRLCFLVYLAHF